MSHLKDHGSQKGHCLPDTFVALCRECRKAYLRRRCARLCGGGWARLSLERVARTKRVPSFESRIPLQGSQKEKHLEVGSYSKVPPPRRTSSTLAALWLRRTGAATAGTLRRSWWPKSPRSCCRSCKRAWRSPVARGEGRGRVAERWVWGPFGVGFWRCAGINLLGSLSFQEFENAEERSHSCGSLLNLQKGVLQGRMPSRKWLLKALIGSACHGEWVETVPT